MKKIYFSKAWIKLMSAMVVACAPIVANSAPGVLSDKPLFLGGAAVQPNILFIVDDSGSMEWETMLSNAATGIYGKSVTPEENNTYRIIDYVAPGWRWRNYQLCPGYNVMAYDPNKKYTPWKGVDDKGNAFADASLASAYVNPYTRSTGNISNHIYYKWDDKDLDGVYDHGECPDVNKTVKAWNCPTITDCVAVSTLTVAEQKNYANWYSYYRKREFVAKRALTELVANSNARVGLATLHNNNTVGTFIKDVDDITVPVSTAAANNKKALLTNIAKINSFGGTPLRQALKRAGQYYTEGQSPGSSFFGKDPGTSSPILSQSEGGSCQQNYAVMMTDGTWNGSNPYVGNMDGDGNTTFDGGLYGDSYSNTLADVAMKYYEGDLHTGLADEVKIITGVDDNPAQHMVTFTVAFGLSGTLPLSIEPTDPSFAGWPKPDPYGTSPETTIDDVRHAAYNGRGKYLSAENPQQLIDSLAQYIGDIGKRQGSAAAVAFSTGSIQTDTLLFQATFLSGDWSGDIKAFNVSKNGVGGAAWTSSAGEQLANGGFLTREIFTYNGSRGVPFKWPASYMSPSASDISSAMVSDLLTGATLGGTFASADAYGKAIVNFLRGDFTYDGTDFRDRKGHRLGDIVYSSPEYLGLPDEGYPETIAPSSYKAFLSAQKSRNPMVYVGANDGLLHGFNAKTGAEVFAYLPSFLASSSSNKGFHYLADKNYIYQPYVDGTPSVGSAYVGGQWRSFLVGGARSGGKGVYVLDVTDPSLLTEANASSVVKFEFTPADSPDIGYIFSKPVIAKLNNDKWAAIFGNGYNADAGDGTAKVFIVYLDGSGYKTLNTGVGSNSAKNCLSSSSDCNGMGGPGVVDVNGDGVADRVFAGDLKGNMWVFDISDTSSSNWRSAYPATGSPQPLFKSPGEPITVRPTIAAHPTKFGASTNPNLMVYFGTGQYITPADATSTPVNAYYGIWDNGQKYGITQNELKQQIITSSGVKRTVTNYSVAYDLSNSTLELGWYEELPASGERIVTPAAVIDGTVFYNTLISDSVICGYGGSGYLMAVDAETGGMPKRNVLDYNNDGTFDAVAGVKLNSIPAQSGFISNRQFTQLSDGSIDFRAQPKRAEPGVESTSLSFDPK